MFARGAKSYRATKTAFEHAFDKAERTAAQRNIYESDNLCSPSGDVKKAANGQQRNVVEDAVIEKHTTTSSEKDDETQAKKTANFESKADSLADSPTKNCPEKG